MRYEMRLYDRESRGPVLFEADTEAELAVAARREWPELDACPYEDKHDEILAVWKRKGEASAGKLPHAIAWRPEGSPPWTRKEWMR